MWNNRLSLIDLSKKRKSPIWERMQRCFNYFRVRRSLRCCWQCRTMRNSYRVEPEIKMADSKPESVASRIANLVYLSSTEFERQPPTFRSPATRWNYCECSLMSGWVANQRWPPLTGSIWYTYILACIYEQRYFFPSAIKYPVHSFEVYNSKTVGL